MSSSYYIVTIVTSDYTIASLVRYCINDLYGCNRSADINKIRRLFLFKPSNIVMKNLEATTQLGGFNQLLQMRHPNKRLP